MYHEDEDAFEAWKSNQVHLSNMHANKDREKTESVGSFDEVTENKSSYI